MKSTPEPKMLTRDEIVQICGDLPDWKIAENRGERRKP